MRVLWRMAQVGVAVAALVAAPAARAQIKGSFDGALDDAQRGVPLTAAAALSQVGKVVSGTMVFAGDPATYGGAFLVHGKATKKRVKLSGVYNSFTLKWTAKIAPGTLTGRAKLKTPGTKIAGILALTENVSTADGSGCDGVYDGNTTLFHDQVLGDALTSCRACHVAGGQADAARFRIDVADERATARSIALLVDAANPDASRILEKPTGVLPHGGGIQLMPGSPQLDELTQWIRLVAAAHCS